MLKYLVYKFSTHTVMGEYLCLILVTSVLTDTKREKLNILKQLQFQFIFN